MGKSFDSFLGEWKLVWRGVKEVHKLQPYSILTAVTSSIFTSLYPFIGIYFSSRIINELVSPNRNIRHVVTYVVWTIILNLVTKLASMALNQLTDIMVYRLRHVASRSIANKACQLDFSDMERPTTKQSMERLNRGRFRRGIIAIVSQVQIMVRAGITCLISIAVVIQMFCIKSYGTTTLDHMLNSPITTLILCCILLLNTWYHVHSSSKIKRAEFQVEEDTAKNYNFSWFYHYNLATEYNLGKDVRLYQEETLLKDEIRYHNKNIMDRFKKIVRMMSVYHSLGAGVQTLMTACIYIYVGLKAMAGAIGVGNIILYTGSILQFHSGCLSILDTITSMKRNSEYLNVYFEFIDTKNRKESGTCPITREDIENAVIEFKNVSFQYPGSEAYSLNHVSLKFHMKDHIAVVGKNGSGKTTFIKLLCRLYDPNEGEIILNGKNIKEYDYNQYLSLFSVVFQDFYIFSFDVGENVAVAADYSKEQVETCMVEAGLKERLRTLKDGVKTQLYNQFSKNGVEISGGEAQKIAIARALYKDSAFVILDEPTAALDPIAEADIYSRLNQLIENKAAVYISHRLSSCYFCKHIAVFDQGELVQYGSHQELVAKENGLYHALWQAQAQYYENS